MRYGEIKEGAFVARPNRFIAKVMIDGREETVHVKNTGRCRELLVPGARVYLERAANPDRKTAYDLVAVVKEGLGLINMDSQAPNRVTGEWLAAQTGEEFRDTSLPLLLAGQEKAAQRKTGQRKAARRKAGTLIDRPFPDGRELPCISPGIFPGPVSAIRPEYVFGSSRMDFYFESGGQKCLMEVKGVTLERERIAYFPDAPTQRGVKHIRELESALELGYRCYLAFVIQMPGIRKVYPNDETHPAFGEALRQAYAKGVEVLALGCEIWPEGLRINRAERMEY